MLQEILATVCEISLAICAKNIDGIHDDLPTTVFPFQRTDRGGTRNDLHHLVEFQAVFPKSGGFDLCAFFSRNLSIK